MVTFDCLTTRDKLIDHLAKTTEVSQVGNLCVVTLPIPTIDSRLVGVFIETTITDYCVVHDGGKAVNELFLQGVKITDSITQHFDALAKRFGVSYTDEVFKATVRLPEVEGAIFAVGMCSSLAMAQLVGHIPVPIEEPLREQFGHVVKGWARGAKFKLQDGVTVKGEYAQHRFDFVAHSSKPKGPTFAMSVLLPGSNSLAAAERFGFKTTDLNSSRRYREWHKVAVQGRAELWSSEARALLERCADLVISLPDDPKIDRQTVKEKLDEAVAA